MEIRDGSRHDHPGIDAVVRDAFADHATVADLVADLRASGRSRSS